MPEVISVGSRMAIPKMIVISSGFCQCDEWLGMNASGHADYHI